MTRFFGGGGAETLTGQGIETPKKGIKIKGKKVISALRLFRYNRNAKIPNKKLKNLFPYSLIPLLPLKSHSQAENTSQKTVTDLSSSKKQERVGLNDGKIPKTPGRGIKSRFEFHSQRILQPVRDDVYSNDAKHQCPKTVKNLFTYSLFPLFPSKKSAFTLAEGAKPHSLFGGSRKVAFTLAEVLITLGIVGVVAALVLPNFVSNIQERIRREQVRTVKYKLTKATDKMNSLGLIGPYATTEEFVNELKKHLSIAKVCDNAHLNECWPTSKLITSDNPQGISVSSLKTGSDIKALSLGTKNSETVGIITGDGTPMIMVYSPVCNVLDSTKQYLWSTVDGKPETNATTNCISAIFDINGTKNPNKIGTDVRTLNSIFGFRVFNRVEGSVAECNYLKRKGLVQYCDGTYTLTNRDTWVGAVKRCDDVGLKLPSLQTLANIAGSWYGRTDIGPYTFLAVSSETYPDCIYNRGAGMYYFKNDMICIHSESGMLPVDDNRAIADLPMRPYWSNAELSATHALMSNRINESDSVLRRYIRGDFGVSILCVAD